ncbi:hypothetical protein OIU74_024177 [Salix koriyanagi]|uniref:Probable magnesium transporter n=1 Tax=Salix koriyanagi TaxID=2511006 RepID=A0A9Q1A883_9ROSI|nr:hypothetical protein OIU74_024177 [Salix koriyanagi]
MYSSNLSGFILALVSSAFIGSSFIIKKKGLRKAGVSGPRASVGGYGYLLEPLWWLGMITMIVGEVSNFVAYVYAPAVLVTPLGALSIIVSAVLAHFLLREKLQKNGGSLGCLLCIVGFYCDCAACTRRTVHQLSYRNLGTSNPACISFVYSLCRSYSIGADFVFFSTLWPNQHFGLYRNLLCNWIIDSDEYKGHWHCN